MFASSKSHLVRKPDCTACFGSFPGSADDGPPSDFSAHIGSWLRLQTSTRSLLQTVRLQQPTVQEDFMLLKPRCDDWKDLLHDRRHDVAYSGAVSPLCFLLCLDHTECSFPGGLGALATLTPQIEISRKSPSTGNAIWCAFAGMPRGFKARAL